MLILLNFDEIFDEKIERSNFHKKFVEVVGTFLYSAITFLTQDTETFILPL